MKKNKNGFTLVEVLAVIAILSIILVIAIPKILSTIDASRLSSFKISANEIVDQAEKRYFAYRAEKLGKPGQMKYGGVGTKTSGADKPCTELVELDTNDYDTCEVTVTNEGVATLTKFEGKGKFKGYSCTGTRDNITCTVDTSN